MSGGTGFGVTPQGFVAPQLPDIQNLTNQSLIAQFGANINLQPQAFFGQLSGIFSALLLLAWQGMQDVYGSQVPDSAFGASLDNVGALRGIPRLAAQASVIQNVKLFGTAGTAIPSNTKFSVAGSPLNIFQISTAAVTLGAGQSCIQNISFSAVPASGTWELAINGEATSPLSYSVTAAQLQTAIQALPFCSGCTVTGNFTTGFTITFAGAGTGGFMVQPLFAVENNSLETSGTAPVIVTPTITTAGIDQANVTVTATSTGPTIANAGTLTNITTPVSGLTNVLNIQDAAVGMNVESDSAYRARMALELQIAGAGTLEALRSRLLQVTGVTSALVYENDSDIVDINGRPPHSFECVVAGGSAQDIANTIWAAKDLGINTYGTQSYTITDSQGVAHVINFSRPSQINVYVIANLTINPLLYPSNGDVLVQEAISNYINALGQGVSVNVVPQMIAALTPIPGIDGATLLVGTSPGPVTSNNIPIAAYQEAFSQTSFVTVVDVDG